MISGTNRETVDFVIIGVGSAGCTFYHQLAKSIQGSFVLLEAGGPKADDPAPQTATAPSPHIPVHYPRLFRSPLDWNYQTVPQMNLANRKITWPRGKGRGGSSLINAMIYLPGSAGDWSALAETWQVSPSELRQHLPHQIPTADWPCAVDAEIHPLTKKFIQSCAQSHPHAPSSFLADEDYSFGIFPRTTRHGRRVNAYQAFVAVAATQRRVQVETNTHVERILFDRGRAVAVQGCSHGKSKTWIANRAVILCAGAIESPAILMRSGIGDAEQLYALGIQVVQDLPGVGQNLQDHLLMPVIVASTQPSLTNNPTLEERQRFHWYGEGPLTSNIAEAGYFFHANAQRIPQLQIHFTPTHYLEYPLRPQPTNAFSFGLTLLQPHSRGQVRLISADASQTPLIDPAYLSNAEDLKLLSEGVDECRQLIAQEPLNNLRGSEILPGEKRATGAALERAIRAYAQTIFHPVGTCAVGSANDSVVDTQFRVHGTEGLYVVDASVFNRIPACNPAAQIMALASLAAQRVASATS